MNTNLEIYNYLNLINIKLGKLYKLTGYNPLPDDFVFDDETIKERLILNQIENSNFPDFIHGSKHESKKYFKNSKKNIKKLLKLPIFKENKSKIIINLKAYLEERKKITEMLLKDFNNQSFDECVAYNEIFSINPVFFEIIGNIFYEDFLFEISEEKIAEKYKMSYLEIIQLLEKKKVSQQALSTKQINSLNIKEKNRQKTNENLKNSDKTNEKLENIEISKTYKISKEK